VASRRLIWNLVAFAQWCLCMAHVINAVAHPFSCLSCCSLLFSSHVDVIGQAFFAEEPVENWTKIMMARRIQLQEGFDMGTLWALVTRCDKRALAGRLGPQ
jgi:hypothetical protein